MARDARTTRRGFLHTAGAALAGLTVAGRPATAAESVVAAHTNIIVILADDLGWGDLSCYPQDPTYPESRIRTPNLDSLAAEGARCTQAYATCMVCAPSRAGLLTGRYQMRFGWYEFVECEVGLPEEETTLAELLRRQGYATACFGKWHVGHKPGSRPLDRGFDRFYGFLGGQHDFYDPRLGDPITAMSFDYDAHVYDQNEPVGEMGYFTDELTARSLEYIRESAAADRPFLLYLSYSAPHPPLQATWEKLEPYAQSRGGKFTSRDIARAMIGSMDDGIGRILDLLLHLGIDRDTIIFFSSDNGGADDGVGGPNLVQHNAGLRARKGFYWEGGIRVPYIVRCPGRIPEGVVYDRPVSHLDIFATAATAAGVSEPPLPLDGVDLLPYLDGRNADMPHPVMVWGQSEEVDRWAVRKGAWKLTHEYRDPQTLYDKSFTMVTELHDLDADPLERVDLSAERPEVVAELMDAKAAYYRAFAPSIATPEVRRIWMEELEARKAKLPNADQLRRDGAPGHWL